MVGSEITSRTTKFTRICLHNLFSKCSHTSAVLLLADRALSDEEAQFPLAYGMLVYKNAVQVYFMLSAVYHPQNAYCVAVDGNTTSEFKRRIGLLAECFPNVYVVVSSSARGVALI